MLVSLTLFILINHFLSVTLPLIEFFLCRDLKNCVPGDLRSPRNKTTWFHFHVLICQWPIFGGFPVQIAHPLTTTKATKVEFVFVLGFENSSFCIWALYQIFLICRYFVCILTMLFKEQMFLILMKSSLSNVSFLGWYFDVVTKKYLSNPRSQRLFYFSYIFYSLGFHFFRICSGFFFKLVIRTLYLNIFSFRYCKYLLPFSHLYITSSMMSFVGRNPMLWCNKIYILSSTYTFMLLKIYLTNHCHKNIVPFPSVNFIVR